MKKALFLALFLSSCGPGQKGDTGAAGLPGSDIQIVQFCPNVSPTYPSIFPEVGFCIDNKLYAVYSANDGFLTEVTPGAYLSNAVGSVCVTSLSYLTV